MSLPQSTPEPVYVVIDIEAAGPNPSEYALLSIGACTTGRPRQTFYVELQPDRDASTPEAMAIHGLSLERLTVRGTPPVDAMRQFAAWLDQVTPGQAQPVFVAFNAPFDWMYVNDYFHRYLGRNPFGHAALDIKAYYMGLHNVPWAETSYRFVSERYGARDALSHHALDDAIHEAQLFEAMLAAQRAHER
ncbi:MAG: 3'-5' exonuclease [Anaerolineae bacterium]|nr:3'-5' exonuclease [Anaerolineae bacterium]